MENETAGHAGRMEYCVISCMREIDDAGRVRTYGIAAKDESGERICIWDISTDPVVVEEIAERCMRMELSPEHLPDILEDYWGEDRF